MTVNYDKIQNDIQTLGTIADNDAFLEGFLSAFNFPKATLARTKTKNNIEQGVYIQGNGNVFFLASNAENLHSTFNILKKNDLAKIKVSFIIIANEIDLLVYESVSKKILETSKRELYKYIEFFYPLLGIKQNIAIDEKSVDIETAKKFAQLHNELILKNPDYNKDIHEFSYRLLFCCFIDSLGILTNSRLNFLISTYTDESGSDTGIFFNNLFKSLKIKSRSNLPRYFIDIKFIDAPLFSETIETLTFSKLARSLILELLRLNWSKISPEIFGALIQSIISDPNANYTLTTNIKKVIDPLFMKELYHSFENTKTNRDGCEILLRRIRSISVFDPSCGTGNFLLVAFKELNELASKVDEAIAVIVKSTVQQSQFLMSQVAENSVSYNSSAWHIPLINFHGITTNSFYSKIARLGFFFIAYQEAKKNLSNEAVFTESLNILFSINIVPCDAIRTNWETICKGNGETYIIGNPPYSGGINKTVSQKADIKQVFTDYKAYAKLDYAACWFMLATKHICTNGGGFAFVTTNSLTQGEQVQLLWPKLFEKEVHIKFAYTSFKWENYARNKTAVTVVIIGIVPNSNTQRCELYIPTKIYEPKKITPYLTSIGTIVQKSNLPISKLPKMVKGNMPLHWSKHLLSHEEKVEIIAHDPRVEKFLRPIIGGDELIDGIEKWCFWIYDNELDEAMSIKTIAEKIELVRKARQLSTDKSAQKHAKRSHQFRETRETRTQSLIIPEVSSEHRKYFQIDFGYKGTIIESTNYVVYDCEPWIFGVIASKMHNLWIRTVCGALETRIRYSPRLGYNTFPFPDITQEQKNIIYKRVLEIIRARQLSTPKTLAQLYEAEQMSNDLIDAHSLLDNVIENCYRDTPFVSDQDRLECLFELYNKLRG